MQPDAGDLARLKDMLNAARTISLFIMNKNLADYLADSMLRSAVERQLEIVGEAARHISKSFQQLHPEVPWSLIIGQRHILSHDYGEIQDERVWNSAFVDMPELIGLIEPHIPPPPPKE